MEQKKDTASTKLTPQQMLEMALTSPALKWQSDKKKFAYPSHFRGRVPLKVSLVKTVKSDLLNFGIPVDKGTIALKDNEYYAWVNSYGAVSAILENGKQLGLLPSEFDVTEWHGYNN